MTTNFKTFDLEFLKPDLDDRSYRFIELPNKLKALLIQDPKADKAAASLDVNIGAFEDPENLPGLAHFCEHLLFMGSEKFPDENEYSSYLSKHGGSSNAYTASQNTNYFFEVNHQHLLGALDRFSGFFSCPLFKKESTDKEINAVNSENKKNLQNDIWRIYQLDKSLTNPNHPYHKFSTGNIETLGESPKENGLNIRDELLKFHKDFYSANIMKLCVLGREDLDTLSEWTYICYKDDSNNYQF
ncbi:metalloprotease [Saccharomyces pastorianus]|uniref:Metalloprotease n=1 Tax=Saccharomyces pastorianus TaxID=27292 RepID=A0A6C1EDQ2_SACPS|nr:metalloprotease [Saccharomyces pastorianus]